MLFCQFNHVFEDDLHIHIPRRFHFFSAADECNIKVALQRDFIPFFRQCFFCQPAVQGIFRRIGTNFPHLHFRIGREVCFRAIGSRYNIICTGVFLRYYPGLDQLNRRISDRFHAVIRDRDLSFFFIQNSGIFTGQEARSTVRPILLFKNQLNLCSRIYFVSFSVCKGQQIKCISFIRYLPLPDLIFFIPDYFGSRFQCGIQIRPPGLRHSKGRFIRNTGCFVFLCYCFFSCCFCCFCLFPFSPGFRFLFGFYVSFFPSGYILRISCCVLCRRHLFLLVMVIVRIFCSCFSFCRFFRFWIVLCILFCIYRCDFRCRYLCSFFRLRGFRIPDRRCHRCGIDYVIILRISRLAGNRNKQLKRAQES